jgi:hypothetical protein
VVAHSGSARRELAEAVGSSYAHPFCARLPEVRLPADIRGIRALSEEPFVTRWSPVDILCEGDVAVRTKLVRTASPDTAAVCVSEAVSHEVFRLIGLHVAKCHAVTIAGDFADDLTRQYRFEPSVSAGRHWGTSVMTATAQEVEFSLDDVNLNYS